MVYHVSGFMCLPYFCLFSCLYIDEFDAYIIVSFINATLVLSIGETVEEVTDSGFLGTTPTLSSSLIGDDALLQVNKLRIEEHNSISLFSFSLLPFCLSSCLSFLPSVIQSVTAFWHSILKNNQLCHNGVYFVWGSNFSVWNIACLEWKLKVMYLLRSSQRSICWQLLCLTDSIWL